MHIVVLGAAAGGGLPQWNCGCTNCTQSRAGIGPSVDHHLPMGTQTSVAVSVDAEHWFLINASPDLRQQVNATRQLHPRTGELRHTPIAGVILTNGEIDAIAGLLSMREGSPFSIYAHDKVLDTLRDNSIFNVLRAPKVQRIPITIDTPFEPQLLDGAASGLRVLPFNVPGKAAWFLDGIRTNDTPGDTLGLRIEELSTGHHFYFIAACARVTPELKTRLANAPLVFFDGTVWHDDEMIAAGLATKTGQDMGHIAMAGEHGAIAELADLCIAQKIFLHINNSNPVLRQGSPERVNAEAAGWVIARDGMEISL